MTVAGVAERAVSWLARRALLAAAQREWADAFLAELDAIEGTGARARWSLGGLVMAGRLAAAAVARRELAFVPIALLIGLAIAYVDSRPAWDDTGITAGALLLGAGVTAAASGRRPLFWALLVGVWTPIVEITVHGQPASLAAIVFAVVGAMGGFLMRRSLSTVHPIA